MAFYKLCTYKVCKNMIKAQDMFDDHVGGQSEFAERAEVISLLSRSITNAFHKVQHAYKSISRGVFINFIFRKYSYLQNFALFHNIRQCYVTFTDQEVSVSCCCLFGMFGSLSSLAWHLEGKKCSEGTRQDRKCTLVHLADAFVKYEHRCSLYTTPTTFI